MDITDSTLNPTDQEPLRQNITNLAENFSIAVEDKNQSEMRKSIEVIMQLIADRDRRIRAEIERLKPQKDNRSEDFNYNAEFRRSFDSHNQAVDAYDQAVRQAYGLTTNDSNTRHTE